MKMRHPAFVSVGLLALTLLIGCATDEDVIGSGRRTPTPAPDATATATPGPGGGATPTPKPTPTPWPTPSPTPTPTLAPLPDPITGPSTGDIDPPPASTESNAVETPSSP